MLTLTAGTLVDAPCTVGVISTWVPSQHASGDLSCELVGAVRAMMTERRPALSSALCLLLSSD